MALKSGSTATTVPKTNPPKAGSQTSGKVKAKRHGDTMTVPKVK